MSVEKIDLDGGTIAFEDNCGSGPLVVLVPGAGDTMAEYRYLAPSLVEAGNRVVKMDLRGHGESSADWSGYRVRDTAADLVAVIEHIDAGPATVVGTSFSPAAALWAASERPELISGLVLISAHLEDPPSWQRALLRASMRGPWAGKLWAKTYRGWYPAAPPEDLADHAASLAAMLRDRSRRKAARETLVASRDGLEERIARVDVPTLVVMGGGDSHFKDPMDEGRTIAERTDGELVVVPDAGHYPHAEFPDIVGSDVVRFLERTAA